MAEPLPFPLIAAALFVFMAVCALSTVVVAAALIDAGNVDNSEDSWVTCDACDVRAERTPAAFVALDTSSKIGTKFVQNAVDVPFPKYAGNGLPFPSTPQ